MKHKTRVIPVFLPMLACPHRCIYCNQYVISGQQKLPSTTDVIQLIDRYLATIPVDFEKRIAFFGGSFTCLPMEVQNRYLDLVQPYLRNGSVSGIQLSTRPDYIDNSILANLKDKRVSLIELGAQSLDDEVLGLAERGHSVKDVERASSLVLDHSIELGLQMMVGLPGDTKQKTMRTAELIHKFGASCTRIYPALVVAGTKMADMYAKNLYTPLSLPDAVEWCKDLYVYFNNVNINILRIGLHPTEDLRSGVNLIAGPFHISFKELVLTAVWRDRIQEILRQTGSDSATITVPHSEINYAVGYNSANKKQFPGVKFVVE